MFALLRMGNASIIFWISFVPLFFVIALVLTIDQEIAQFVAGAATLGQLLIGALLFQVIIHCSKSIYLHTIPDLDKKVKNFCLSILTINFIFSILLIGTAGNFAGVNIYIFCWLLTSLLVYGLIKYPAIYPIFIPLLIALECSCMILGFKQKSDFFEGWNIYLTTAICCLGLILFSHSKGLNYIEKFQTKLLKSMHDSLNDPFNPLVGNVPNMFIRAFSPYLLVNASAVKYLFIGAIAIFTMMVFVNYKAKGDVFAVWLLMFTYTSLVVEYTSKGIAREWKTVLLMPTFNSRKEITDKYIVSGVFFTILNVVFGLLAASLILKGLPDFSAAMWVSYLICPFSILSLAWYTEDMEKEFIRNFIYVASFILYILLLGVSAKLFSDLVDVLIICALVIPQIIYCTNRVRQHAPVRDFA